MFIRGEMNGKDDRKYTAEKLNLKEKRVSGEMNGRGGERDDWE